jgi:hypothetical protein
MRPAGPANSVAFSLPRATVRGLLGAAALIAALLAVVPSIRASQSPCSWSGESDQRDVNVGAPDLDALYYATSVAPAPGTKIVLAGRFPNARYFSFTLYDARGQPVASAYDAQIDPDRGSASPFRGAVPRRAADRYHLQVLFTPRPARPADNTLYVRPPAGPAAALRFVMRVYVPADRSRPGPFPSLTTETAAGHVLVARGACATISSTGGAARWERYARSSAPRGAPTPAFPGAGSPPDRPRNATAAAGAPASAGADRPCGGRAGSPVPRGAPRADRSRFKPVSPDMSPPPILAGARPPRESFPTAAGRNYRR